MKTLKEWADFYVGKRLWVYPYRDYYEQFKWLDWRNMKDPKYHVPLPLTHGIFERSR